MSVNEAAPASRSLDVVLRDALSGAVPVQLVIGTARPDGGAGFNANAHINVVVGGVQVRIAKLATSGLGDAVGGYPVYVLVAPDFMLAIGRVSTATAPLGNVSVASLAASGNISAGGNIGASGSVNAQALSIGPFDMHGSATTDLYIRNVFYTGALVPSP